MIKTVYQVRSKLVRWVATFQTLEDAQAHIPKDWGFRDDPTVYIVKVTTESAALGTEFGVDNA